MTPRAVTGLVDALVAQRARDARGAPDRPASDAGDPHPRGETLVGQLKRDHKNARAGALRFDVARRVRVVRARSCRRDRPTTRAPRRHRLPVVRPGRVCVCGQRYPGDRCPGHPPQPMALAEGEFERVHGIDDLDDAERAPDWRSAAPAAASAIPTGACRRGGPPRCPPRRPATGRTARSPASTACELGQAGHGCGRRAEATARAGSSRSGTRARRGSRRGGIPLGDRHLAHARDRLADAAGDLDQHLVDARRAGQPGGDGVERGKPLGEPSVLAQGRSSPSPRSFSTP